MSITARAIAAALLMVARGLPLADRPVSYFPRLAMVSNISFDYYFL